MVKTKQKPVAAVLLKINDSQNSFHNFSDVAVESDLPGEDSWVVVKKQKVTIRIPHLPSSEQCTLPDLDLSQGQPYVDMPSTANVTSAPPQLPLQKPRDICLAEKNDGDMPLLPESDGQSGRKVHTPPGKEVSNPVPGRMDSRAYNIEHQDGVLRPLCRKKRSLLKFHDIALMPSTAFGQRGQSRVDLPCCTTILNKTMRASNLKMKIVRAGGLSRWLSSLGLEQFERIFHEKNMNNFQVANLSMNKLKEMGYHAVGPRRKLIHAIECLYHSYNFSDLISFSRTNEDKW